MLSREDAAGQVVVQVEDKAARAVSAEQVVALVELRVVQAEPVALAAEPVVEAALVGLAEQAAVRVAQADLVDKDRMASSGCFRNLCRLTQTVMAL